ncbi:hypothetical protein HDV06_003290 [Boothiomyces sp. JEL0866]|nr:hypothetical protein HDV06_003290 [Boothiomyces sp. JEL0866]
MARKVKAKPAQPLEFTEILTIIGAVAFIGVLAYYCFFYRKRNRYHQDDPYVAKVDLKERYGELEKRAVKIDDLDTETLLLLKRDGKLNDSTVERLIDIGKLPGKDGKFKKVRKTVEKEKSAAVEEPQVPTTPTPKKRGRPKKKK